MDDQNANPTEFDVIVWGATGFTGKIVVEYLHQTYGNQTDQLTWAIAGRDADKLKAVIDEVGCDKVPCLLADGSDRAALDALVAKTRVVLSTVGPYALYGSLLVAACAASGTHYCDLTGEVQWMRLMIDAHHDEAVRTGAKIVHTCGFDSIPSDLGVHFLQGAIQERLGQPAEQVKYRLVSAAGGVSGGTVASMLNMMDEVAENPQLLTVLADPYALNPLNTVTGQDENEAAAPLYDEVLGQWVGPFVMAGINTRVVRRSHALLGMPYGPGFAYEEGTLIGAGPTGFLKALMASIGTWVGMLLSAMGPTRRLLARFLKGQIVQNERPGFLRLFCMAPHPRVRIQGKFKFG